MSVAALKELPFTLLVTYLDQAKTVRASLGAMLGTLGSFPNARLLLVDNGSADGSPAILDELELAHENFRWVAEERRGVYYARRRALIEAETELCIFVDDDAAPSERFFLEMLRALTSSPKVGAVGGRVDLDPAVAIPPWVPQRLLSEFAVLDGQQSGIEEAAFPRLPTGVALALRKGRCTELWCGEPRRTDYPLGRRKADPERGIVASGFGGEDSDLALVFLRSGYRVLFAHDARVTLRVPLERLDPGWFVRRFAAEGRTRVRLLRLMGLSPLGAHGLRLVIAWLGLILLLPLTLLLPARHGLFIRAYFAKSWGAFAEWAAGPRLAPFPFAAEPGAKSEGLESKARRIA